MGQVSDLPVQGVSDSVNSAGNDLNERELASRGGRNRQVRDLTHTQPLAILANDDNPSLTPSMIPSHAAATPIVARNAGITVVAISCDQSAHNDASPMPSTVPLSQREWCAVVTSDDIRLRVGDNAHRVGNRAVARPTEYSRVGCSKKANCSASIDSR